MGLTKIVLKDIQNNITPIILIKKKKSKVCIIERGQGKNIEKEGEKIKKDLNHL